MNEILESKYALDWAKKYEERMFGVKNTKPNEYADAEELLKKAQKKFDQICRLYLDGFYNSFQMSEEIKAHPASVQVYRDAARYSQYRGYNVYYWESSGFFVRTIIVTGDDDGMKFYHNVLDQKNFNFFETPLLDSFFDKLFHFVGAIKKIYSNRKINKKTDKPG